MQPNNQVQPRNYAEFEQLAFDGWGFDYDVKSKRKLLEAVYNTIENKVNVTSRKLPFEVKRSNDHMADDINASVVKNAVSSLLMLGVIQMSRALVDSNDKRYRHIHVKHQLTQRWNAYMSWCANNG